PPPPPPFPARRPSELRAAGAAGDVDRLGRKRLLLRLVLAGPRGEHACADSDRDGHRDEQRTPPCEELPRRRRRLCNDEAHALAQDRKSTRPNSSHEWI